MAPPRSFLVVEDDPDWREIFRTDLHALVPGARVDEAAGYDEAARMIAGSPYDAVILDLRLPRQAAGGTLPEDVGQVLARQVRDDPRNRHAGLIVVTAYPSSEGMRAAFADTHVADFLAKQGVYTSEAFHAALRVALREAAVRRAEEGAAREVRLEIQASGTAVNGARMAGPRHASYPCREPLDLPVEEWTARGDALNALLRERDRGGWRAQAREVGHALFDHLFGAPELREGLGAVRGAGHSADELCLQLHGPASLIGVPFELMRDGAGDPLAFLHRMIRTVTRGAGAVAQHISPFFRLVERAAEERTPLRALVVGANVDGRIPGAEDEARNVAAQLRTELGQLGVDCEVTLLVGPDATRDRVAAALERRDTHLFHYAGHGRFNDAVPESSGLVLGGDAGRALLRATDLRLLCRDSPLSLVFLSCCLGARSAAEPERGDFAGLFDALARADVPIMLGYRWILNDPSALAMASDFYGWLFRTLSPSEALFRAREGIARSRGWDNETWLSPILVVQNP